ncbi:protein ELC-like [Rutidosis leptorrhynchoides]|uniref:protein ELC-like n=1 Tax=Rutidosis leptorrhynchoides TaxID=125765 RepID=UPI003A9909BF
MTSPSPIDIIDNAMFSNTAFALAYTDPDQKWLIRKHLLSLHSEFPSLFPAIDTFTHNDGTIVNLLKIEGYLHIDHSLPMIHLNIWIHELYPSMAPMVQVTTDQTKPIRSNHPFVDPSGVTTSSYLHTWVPYRYDLLGLVYNLVNLFSLDHPFYFLSVPSKCHVSYMSKIECMDQLWCMLHYDMIAFRETTNDEVEKLTNLQDTMRMRVDITNNHIIELDREQIELKKRVEEMINDADTLINWLTINKVNLSLAMGGKVEDAFECVDDESKLVMELVAEDKALDDMIYALEQYVGRCVMSYECYIKQVRILARGQFFVRAKLEKLKGPQILEFLD